MTEERIRWQRLIDVACGRIPGDLVIRNCWIVDVYSQTIRKGDILIVDGAIAGTEGPYEAREVVDAGGAYAAPGLIESHIHIESSYVSPEEFGRLVVPRGTTTVVADPHEIVNVCGAEGLHYMAEAAEKTALDIRFMAPPCVPASPYDHNGCTVDAASLKKLLEDPRTFGVGEFMDYNGILDCHDDALDKIIYARRAGKPIDGHCPGVHGRNLQAYAATGIRTDHESSTLGDVEERLRAGLYVMLRNGSACHELPKLVKAVTPANLRRFLLCSDDLHLKTILEKGHLNEHLRLCIAAGLSPEAAITMATLNPADCYHFDDRGALAPGKRADIVLFEDLKDFHVLATYIKGKKAADHGQYLLPVKRTDPGKTGHSVHIQGFTKEKLVMHLSSDVVRTIDLIPGSVVSGEGKARIRRNEEGGFPL